MKEAKYGWYAENKGVMVWYGQKGAGARGMVQITQKTLSRFNYLRLKLGEKERLDQIV